MNRAERERLFHELFGRNQSRIERLCFGYLGRRGEALRDRDRGAIATLPGQDRVIVARAIIPGPGRPLLNQLVVMRAALEDRPE